MNAPSRVITFVTSAIALCCIFYFFQAGLPLNSVYTVIVFSSLVFLSFTTLFIEHWFTKPTDSIAASISVLLVLAPSRPALTEFGIWYFVFFTYLVLILIVSSLSILLFDPQRGESANRNIYAKRLRTVASTFGRSKLLYSALFFLTVFYYFDTQSTIFILTVIYAGLILAIDPKKLPNLLKLTDKTLSGEIGEIIGVQSRHTYIAKLHDDRPKIRRFDFVEFANASDESITRKGIIIDNWILNSQQWIKVLSGTAITETLGGASKNQGLRSNALHIIESDDTQGFLDRFVGTVSESTNILDLRFEYSGQYRVKEGTLVEVTIRDQNVLYQITQGATGVRILENKNEAGLVLGHASQIGVWNANELKFDRFGWVPEMNFPVVAAAMIEPVDPPLGEMLIGNIPETNYPVFMDKNAAVNCHMAVLGVTGTGKSVFSRNLVRNLAADGMKIICVDFTGEYSEKMMADGPVPVVPQAISAQLFQTVDALQAETAKFENQWNLAKIVAWEQELRNGFRDCIENFLNGDARISIFELPDVANSTSILSYTRWFFKVLFEMAKEKLIEDQICVVLEEAHTVIPEWNFAGSEGKGSQALLNQIGQIALQGRKYGVGFMVIAQRTASVSKTVLTQCNTIIAFQQFDKTSGDFLSNYMGQNMVGALQNLESRHAIAVGKAFRNGLPTIFKVPDIHEP